VSDPRVAWGVAAAVLGGGGLLWGWRGAVLALSAIVFWVLAQLTQSMRLMRRAAERPLGQVDSAVMLQARLHPGLQMLDVIRLAGSLGRRVEPASDDHWAWSDAGGAEVVVTFRHGRCERWELQRLRDPDA
jgi:hypothetical protein